MGYSDFPARPYSPYYPYYYLPNGHLMGHTGFPQQPYAATPSVKFPLPSTYSTYMQGSNIGDATQSLIGNNDVVASHSMEKSINSENSSLQQLNSHKGQSKHQNQSEAEDPCGTSDMQNNVEVVSSMNTTIGAFIFTGNSYAADAQEFQDQEQAGKEDDAEHADNSQDLHEDRQDHQSHSHRGSSVDGSLFPYGRKRLSNQERRSIYETLLKGSKNGKLGKGYMKSVAFMYHLSTKSIQRIWQRAASSLETQPFVDVSHRFSRSGCKRKHADFSKILDVPLRRRTNIRSLANALDMSKSAVHRGIKEGKIRPHSNALKPQLTEENKRSRIKFCLSMLETPCPCKPPTFKEMMDVVHVDEKLFYMSRETQKYYLLPNEDEPHRSCQSRRFIPKVMFLGVVGRPRFDHLRNKEFLGKIGMFPFVFEEPAKRKSKNRDAGVPVTKPITSITKDVYRRCLIEKVLPAIREKWPRFDGIQKIYIQQDNAKPHIDPMDDEFRRAASIGDFEMHLTFQPSNSPDMNVLDLGFFNSIQSLQHQKAPKMINDLINAVEESFNEMSSETINNVFLTLQASMVEVLKHNGGFNYKLPHMGKGRLKNASTLPLQLQCQTNVVESASMQLQSSEVNRWSEVGRWIICRDYVCMKHHIPVDQPEANTVIEEVTNQS